MVSEGRDTHIECVQDDGEGDDGQRSPEDAPILEVQQVIVVGAVVAVSLTLVGWFEGTVDGRSKSASTKKIKKKW